MSKTIKICTGVCCSGKGSQKTYEELSNKFPDKNIQTCPCQGNCENAPTVVVSTPEVFKEVHSKMNTEKIKSLL